MKKSSSIYLGRIKRAQNALSTPLFRILIKQDIYNREDMVKQCFEKASLRNF